MHFTRAQAFDVLLWPHVEQVAKLFFEAEQSVFLL